MSKFAHTLSNTDNPFNKQNEEGMVSLHGIGWLDPRLDKNDKDNLLKLDENKACIAAFLIINDGSLSMKDNAGKLPIDYALENKDLLPITLLTLQAGTIKQNYEAAKLPRGRNIVDLSKALFSDQDDSNEYFRAVNFLFSKCNNI